MVDSDVKTDPAEEIARLAYQEANHRLANSLHLLTIMLAADERRVVDAAAKIALAKTRTRLMSVARLSRVLCAADVEKVDLDTYLFEVCNELAESFTDLSGAELVINIDTLPVSSPIARTLGLVLNEMVVNVLKHGAGSDGVIDVACGRNAAGAIELRVINDANVLHLDNGPGVGTAIIESLMKTHGGRFTLEQDDRRIVQIAILPRG